MMKKLWTLLLAWCGWTYDPVDPSAAPYVQKAVMIMAPHTSFYDFFVGAGDIFKLGINSRIFIKKELFNFFTKPFLRWVGAVPVDRTNSAKGNALVETAVKYFNQEKKFTLVITPEGTRKAVKKWKRGFYMIAVEAKVPILLTYIDYKTKHMGVGPAFWPTGDYEADLPKIKAFYNDKNAKHPEGWDNG